MVAAVRPDTSAHVARTGGEVAAHRAGRDGDDRVLVTLQHKLCVTRPGVPELDTTVLGTGQDPLGIGGESDGEDEILIKVSGDARKHETNNKNTGAKVNSPYDPQTSGRSDRPWGPGWECRGATQAPTS